MKKEVLIIAGEKSGEEHALSFCQKILELDSKIGFFGVGGDQLKNDGMDLLFHLKDFSSWGVSEVIGKIPFYFNALKKIEQEVEKRNCRYAILIDFQSFNQRLAKRLKQKGVKVFYYVAPQAWAWKEWRAKTLGDNIHTLFTIIPFEKKWFQERGVKNVYSVPHPLLINYKKDLENYKKIRGFSCIEDCLKLLLLPGSRNFEVRYLLPDFISVVKNIRASGRKVEVGIVCSQSVDQKLYEPYLSDIEHIYDNDQLVEALSDHDASIAASGTVTLACALFELPTVVAYKSSLLNEYIFHTFVKYNGFISLANIVHQEEVFPELIGEQASSYNMEKVLNLFINDENLYNKKRRKLATTQEVLAGETFDIAQYIINEMTRMDHYDEN